MYAGDHNDEVLSFSDGGWAGPIVGGGQNQWRFLLHPYVGDWQIFNCPVGRDDNASNPSVQMINNYGYNSYVSNLHTLGRIKRPSERIVLADSGHWNAAQYNGWCMVYAGGIGKGWLGNVEGNAALQIPANLRHEGSNLAFCNGHVEFKNWKQLSSDRLLLLNPAD